MAEVMDVVAAIDKGFEMTSNRAAAAGVEGQNNAPMEIAGVTEIKDNVSEIMANTTSIATDVSSEGWFYNTLQQILAFNESTVTGNTEAKSLQESMADSLGDMLNFTSEGDKDTKKDKNKKGKATKAAKFDDLKELPWAMATLGAVLANELKPKEDEGKKKGGISGFFKGLLEGVAGIAALGVALLAFAGASLIFSFVDWGKAVIGMLAFTVFTIGMVAVAKLLGKEQNNLTQFAEASLIMSAALGVFAISLWLVSAVVSAKQFDLGPIHIAAFDIKSAAIGLGLFMAFELGMVGLAKLLGNSQGDFQKFAMGSLIMTAALAAFAISLVVVSNVMAAKEFNILGLHFDAIDLGQAMLGVVLFLGFEIRLALCAKIMGNFTGDFVKFAVGSLIMTAALVAFTVSLVVVSGIITNGVHIGPIDLPAVDIPAAIVGVGLFMGFLIGMAVLANVAGGLIAPMALMSLVSMLMSVSLILFSFALIASGIAAFGGEADLGPLGHFSAPEGIGFKALASIPLMAGFMAAFAGLGMVFMIPFAGQAMLAGIMMASGVLMAIGATVIVMAKAMALAGLITTGGEMEWEGKKFTMVPMDESKIDSSFDPFFTLMDKVVEMGKKIQGQGGFFPWQRKKGVDVGAIRMVGSVAEVVAKVAECIAESMMVRKKVEDAGAVWDVHVMDGCLDYVLQVVEKLGVVADSMGFWAAIKLPIITKSMMPVIDAMDKIVDVIEKALTMKTRLQKEGVVFQGSGIDPEILNGICDPVLQVLLGPNMDGEGGLAGAADSLGYWGAKALEKVTASMVPVAETIGLLVDNIEKAATLGGNGESAKELIDRGVQNMTYIMVGEGETETSGALWWKKETLTGGFVGLFNTIAKGVEKIGPAAESIKSMKDLVESLVAVFEAVQKLSGADPGDISKVVDNFGRILGKKSSWTFHFNWFKSKVEKNEATGLMAVIEALAAIDKKDLKNAAENATSMKTMIEGVADMMKATSTLSSGEGFDKLANVPDFKHFAKSMDDFDDGMKWLAKAYDRVKDIPDKWINTMSHSFDEISEASLDNLDKMALFSERARALGDTAANLEKIANAFHKINKENRENALAGAADKLGRLASDVWGNITGKGTAEQKGEAAGEEKAKSVPKGQELQFIAQTISKWDASGVKVYGIATQDKAKAVRTITI